MTDGSASRAGLFGRPHRRRNLLTGDWVLVSPHRSLRPWQGSLEVPPAVRPVQHDPGCYLCPGNARAGAQRNPPYTDTFVFTNDYSALLPDTAPADAGPGDLLEARAEQGVCRVICFSPRHDLTLAEMETGAIRRVVDLWVDEFLDLGDRPGIQYVQIFENKGPMMGASNPHPHGQIWAQESVPGEPAKESLRQQEYFARTGATLLSHYLRRELEEGTRIVAAGGHFVALVPFWAVWPYEVMVISRRPAPDLGQLGPDERNDLADIVRRVAVRYDNLFRVPFPYSAGIHQRPTDGLPHPEWHLHMHFYPPLLRSASIRKFMVGYEMLAEPQRDITPEASAATLRGLSEAHYTASSGSF